MKENVFRSILSLDDMSIRELVEEMNRGKEKKVMTTSTFYKKMKGKSEFNAFEIKEITRILKLTNEQVLTIFFNELVSFKTLKKQEA